MPKLKENQVPSYRLHKQSGQAIVTLSGRDFLLGKHGGASSKSEYRRLTGEWRAAKGIAPVIAGTDLAVSELILAFWRHAQSHYRKPDGTPTSEIAVYKQVLKVLRRLYGHTRAKDFGPLCLKAVMSEMIAIGWCRTSINAHAGRIKHVFAWAVENELLPDFTTDKDGYPTSLLGRLKPVKGLLEGRTAARESDPVRPVPEDYVKAVLPLVSEQVKAMIELQLVSAARPGEICAMRGCDLDTTGKLWTYRLAQAALAHWRAEFYRHDGAKYVVVQRERLRADLYDFLETVQVRNGKTFETFIPTQRRVNELLDALAALVQVPIDAAPAWLDAQRPRPSDLITFVNGMIDVEQVLRDGSPKLIPPTPAWFTLNALPFRFEPQARCPQWVAFLREVLDGDEERIALLQEYLGYVLTQDTRQQKALLLIGLPRGGKGTVLRAFGRAAGEGNIVSLSLITLADRFGLTPLLGRSLAICGDVHLGRGSDSILVLERLKSVIGEDAQQIDRKHLSALPSVRLTTRFVLACNEFPKLPDASAAMRSRLLPLPFHNTYEGKEDFTLEEKISGETLGIILWGLEGLYRMRQRGRFQLPAASEDLLKQFARLSSPVLGFIEDCCEVQSGTFEAVEFMWSAWKKWCQDNGHEAGSKNTFGSHLAAAVPGLSRARKRDEQQERYPIYRGIRLKAGFSPDVPDVPI